MQGTLHCREAIEMAQSIIDTLKQEHRVVLSKLAELSSEGVSDRKQKYESLKDNLIPHLVGEEKALYPRLKEDSDMRSMVLESIEEHGAVKTLLSRLDDASISEEEIWVAKMKVIRENVEHHVNEEEEGEIFPAMQQKMSSDELSTLNARYMDAKKAVLPVASR
jgi:iron-sulfur cluster repair protein YtfE (RIC family)